MPAAARGGRAGAGRLDTALDRLGGGLDRLLAWAVARRGRAVALVALVAGLAVLPGLFALPVTARDEARFVQATKQMMETGDLVDIRFQDRPRWKKPIGIYWLQAAAALPFGAERAGVWAYRLPSALAVVLAALATVWAARPLVSARAAVLAGLALPLAVLVAVEATIAKTDASLMLTAVVAFGALARALTGQAGRWDWLWFWLAIAAAVLLKGPIVPLVALLATGAFWALSGRRPALATLRPLPGLALAGVLVAPWLVAITIESDGAFFAESIGQDLLGKVAEGQEKHWGPPGLYAAIVWGTFWPLASLLPGALAFAWARRRETAVMIACAWVVPFWLVLEAVPTKLPHYVLPLYPALAILVAAYVEDGVPPVRRWLAWTMAVLAALPGVALGLAALALPLVLEGRVLWPAALLGLAGAALALLAARAALDGRLRAQAAAGGLASAAILWSALQFGLPALDTPFATPRLMALVERARPCGAGPLVSLGYREPSLVFRAGIDTRLADAEETAGRLIERPGTLALVENARRDDLDAALARRSGGSPPALRALGEARYFNYNRGRFETASLLVRDLQRFDACTPPRG
ncbi:MAG: ArnT family glycosyltransferase [Paracoccaceae bacterium]